MLAAMTAGNDRFRELSTLKEENERLKRALEERKVIEKAKGILMRREGISEDEAYRRIQKLSMDRRKKMIDIADALILTEDTTIRK